MVDLYRTFLVGDGLITDPVTGQTDLDATFSPEFVGLILTGDLTLSLTGATPEINATAGPLGLNTVNNQPITTGAGLFTAGGGVTVTGTLDLDGNAITSAGDLTITPGGGDTVFVGNVGIGATSSGAKLEIALGNVSTAEAGLHVDGEYNISGSPMPADWAIADIRNSNIRAASGATNISTLTLTPPIKVAGDYTLAAGGRRAALQINDGTNNAMSVADLYAIYSESVDVSFLLGGLSLGSDLSFKNDARIAWTKITASAVTLDAGTSSEGVADLQTANDGNVFHVQEAAGTPGQTIIVDFVGVTAINWVQVLSMYEGSLTHAFEIELWDWVSSDWEHSACMQSLASNGGTIFCDHSFFMPDDTRFIGTGGDAGKVRVRLNHPMSGNASHDSWTDVVALYQ